jgi:hypothetical protein
MSDQPVARPLPTQNNSAQTDADKHPCLERDSNPRSQQPTGQDPRLRLHGHCDRQSITIGNKNTLSPLQDPDNKVWNKSEVRALPRS